MAATLQNLFGRMKVNATAGGDGDFKRSGLNLFPKTDPAVDGEDCLHDCESCSVKLPRKWSIDEDVDLYGGVKGWHRHLVVATGKTDWVRDVEEESGSFLEAFSSHKGSVNHGRVMLSASNMPTPHSAEVEGTTVILLPSFTVLTPVKPEHIPTLVEHVINPSAINSSPLLPSPSTMVAADLPFTVKPCPHDYLILLCSHGTRDARCGQSAPLLRKEFERHLRPLGLQRDLDDERPGGVGIYFISHVGGHKFSANVIIYRRAGMPGVGEGEVDEEEKERHPCEAGQCIWLARVRPEDCENIIRYTVLQGKVVKPERQLRGGFDRCKQLVSW